MGGSVVYVACSTDCFAKYPLDQALRIIAELEFGKVEVAIAEDGAHLKPSEVVADVAAAALRIRIGPGLTPAAFDLKLSTDDLEEGCRQFRAVCRLARQSTVPLVTLPASPVGCGLDAEVARLSRFVNVAEVEGIVLAVPTVTGTLTELPDTAVELCQRVPGLSLTLDPSHYIAGPNQGKNFDHVFPFVRHVHLRDTGRGPNQFQVRIGQGEVEYGRIVSQLSRYHYDRLLTVHIRDVPGAPFVMEPEARKLKYLLESLV